MKEGFATRWLGRCPHTPDLGVYIRVVADLLGLHDWTITLANDPAGDGCEADIDVVYGQHRATIRLAANHTTWSPEDTRATVVHELLHCHLEPLTDLVTDMISETAGSRTSAVAHAAHRHLSERTVDAIAQAIAPYLPLPGDVA